MSASWVEHSELRNYTVLAFTPLKAVYAFLPLFRHLKERSSSSQQKLNKKERY